MLYCLIKNSSLDEDNMKINYNLFDDSEDIKICKIFKINFDNNHVTHVNFSQSQFRDNSFNNYIQEITNDFFRSKYIFGKQNFENYFFEFSQFNEINNKFKFKYIKVDDLLKKLHILRNVGY